MIEDIQNGIDPQIYESRVGLPKEKDVTKEILLNVAVHQVRLRLKNASQKEFLKMIRGEK